MVAESPHCLLCYFLGRQRHLGDCVPYRDIVSYAACCSTNEVLALLGPALLEGMLISYSDWPAGWLIVWGLCYVAAFPPMIGYSTSVSMAGFIYGFPNGYVHQLGLEETSSTAYSGILRPG